jgi:thiamine kinase-like enzyme
VSGFVALGATWSSGERMTEGQIVCHGDAAPWNVVWRDNKLIGLIDFDHARPGAAADDVAYALRYIAPFYDDDECLRWLRFDDSRTAANASSPSSVPTDLMTRRTGSPTVCG